MPKSQIVPVELTKKKSQILSQTWWFKSIEPRESQNIKHHRCQIKDYLLKNSLKNWAVYKIVNELLKNNVVSKLFRSKYWIKNLSFNFLKTVRTYSFQIFLDGLQRRI